DASRELIGPTHPRRVTRISATHLYEQTRVETIAMNLAVRTCLICTTGKEQKMSAAAIPNTPQSDPRRWRALAVLGLIQFMLVVDVSIVNVALPRIQHDLGFSHAGLAWVVNGYVLMAGGLLLLGGRMADILGRRRLFLLGVAVFAIASATCGAAVNPAMLVVSRFVQGAGEEIGRAHV